MRNVVEESKSLANVYYEILVLRTFCELFYFYQGVGVVADFFLPFWTVELRLQDYNRYNSLNK